MNDKLLMMPWFPESFIAATRGWNLTQRAIYRELLDAQWIGGSLPADEEELMRLAGATKQEWAKAWPAVKKKFELVDGVYTNDRLEQHRTKALSLTAKRKLGAYKTNAKRYGNASLSESLSDRPASAQRSHDSDSDSSVLRTGDSPRVADPPDFRKSIFDLGVKILGEKSRGLIGKAVSEIGDSKVGEILGSMAAKPPVDPVSYFAKAIKPRERQVAV